MEFTRSTLLHLGSCCGRLMKCFMLEELIVGMLHKESVGLSCHLLSAFHKLSELLESKGCKMAKARWCILFIQISCHNHHLCGKREVTFWFRNDCLLVHGNLHSRNCHIIPMSIQLQFIQNISITVNSLLAEISP